MSMPLDTAKDAVMRAIAIPPMNHLDRVDELPPSVSVLLLHGTDDTSVPVSISEDFA